MPNIKTAVSLPGPLFTKAERLAKELKISRSRLFALALEDFLAARENAALLSRINAVHDEAGDGDDSYQARRKDAHRRLVRGEW
ncbi:MAG: hypothetical protein ACM3X6_13580 [Patescibacteria group bacterium]